jgi:opacity protein-like surface antigen
MRRMIVVSSLLLSLSTSVMAAQVYKWVDAQGVTHFGAQPPQGQQATSINVSVPQPKQAQATPQTTPAAAATESNVDADQATIDKKVKAEVAANEAERKQYCQDARVNLSQLENNPRLRIEVDGVVTRIDEDERQKRISDLRKSISENCK